MQNVFVLKSNGKDSLHKSPRSPIILQSVSLTQQLSLPSIRKGRHISNPFVRISFQLFNKSQREVIRLFFTMDRHSHHMLSFLQ